MHGTPVNLGILKVKVGEGVTAGGEENHEKPENPKEDGNGKSSKTLIVDLRSQERLFLPVSDRVHAAAQAAVTRRTRPQKSSRT